MGWTSGTLSDLDLTDSIHPWRLKTEAKAKEEAELARLSLNNGTGGGGWGGVLERKKGAGAPRMASMPVDPVRWGGVTPGEGLQSGGGAHAGGSNQVRETSSTSLGPTTAP